MFQMKKIIFSAFFCFSFLYSYAQVAIGKTSITNTSVSLEFSEAENRGLILPWVNDAQAMTDAVPGTLVYDLKDHKVKKKDKLGNWFDFSVNTSGTTAHPFIPLGDWEDLQRGKFSNPAAKTSIGTPGNTPGILVLEDKNKGMILPKVVNPHLNIINPAPGMIVFDPNTNQICVYNGAVWTYWRGPSI